MILALWIEAAWACGGFFCDSVEPVEQIGERILFRQETDGRWTTFVEVRFAGPPIGFGWVVPIEVAIDPEAAVSVAPAGLFDELEVATAPRFYEAPAAAAADIAEMSAGCGGCGVGDAAWSTGVVLEPVGVEVVGQAVVGPYAVEVITADDGDNLAMWLQLNGYRMPSTAADPIDAYLDQGYAFLGIKLLPGVPSGPIDTLVIDCGASVPTIPLMLTAIAAVPDMPITVYVLGEDRFVPTDPWPEVPFDPSGVRFVGDDGQTDYTEQLLATTRQTAGFVTEGAGPIDPILPGLSPEVIEALGHGDVLTRMHTFASPDQMTADPVFVADPDAPDVDNVHYIGHQTAAAGLGSVLGLLGIGIGVARRRRDLRPIDR